MAASGDAPGGFGGWCVSWRAADGGGVLMGAVGQPFARSQKSRSLCDEAALPPHARRQRYIVLAAGITASRADARVGTDAFCAC